MNNLFAGPGRFLSTSVNGRPDQKLSHDFEILEDGTFLPKQYSFAQLNALGAVTVDERSCIAVT